MSKKPHVIVRVEREADGLSATLVSEHASRGEATAAKKKLKRGEHHVVRTDVWHDGGWTLRKARP